MSKEQDNQIERWRFDALRAGAVEALNDLTAVLFHLETGNYLGPGEDYTRIAKAMATLVVAINKGVEE